MRLYTCYRSQASFRVRIALNPKGLSHQDSFLHLARGDQFAAEYRALNRQMMAPTPIDGATELLRSLAILRLPARRLSAGDAGLRSLHGDLGLC